MQVKKAPARFELTISCLLDRRFNQLSHGAIPSFAQLKLSQHGMILQNYTWEKVAPNVGLEPTTLRLRVSCSTDWASRAAGDRKGFGVQKDVSCWSAHIYC